MLVVAFGIGRLYERGSTTPPIVAAKPDSVPAIAARPAVPESLPQQPTTPKDAVGKRERAGNEAAPTTDTEAGSRHESGSGQPFSGRSSSTSYQLAVVQHLAGTEAMLTSFRAAAKRGEVDAQITTWARNLLTTTRLLQASAAQEDPTMKRLLDDLELVLVQIAQYTSAGPHHAEELELIEHSIARRGVIGKLHTNIPARVAPAGT
jgi:hypothetical protein